MITPKTLVLCSGGLDSVVAAAVLRKQNHNVSLFYVAYGSLAEEQEIMAVGSCAAAMEISCVILPHRCRELYGSTAMNSQSQDPGGSQLSGQQAWVPARNLLLLSLATVYAARNGFNNIAIGNIADGIYADNKVEFTDRFERLLELASSPVELHCLAPVVHLTKTELIREGVLLHVPYGLTWSCYRSGDLHCGTCGSCVSRARAFKAAEVDDRVRYEKLPLA